MTQMMDRVMVDRAPDGQPTENLRTALYNEQQRLSYWEQVHTNNHRALRTSTAALASQLEATQKAEGRLSVRLQEEQSREVNGL